MPGVGGQPIPLMARSSPSITSSYDVSDLTAQTWLYYTPMSTPDVFDYLSIDALLLVNFPDLKYMTKRDDGTEEDSGFYIGSGYQFMIVYPSTILPTLDQGSGKQSHGYIRSTNNKNRYTTSSNSKTAKYTARRMMKDLENGAFYSWTEWQQLW